MRSPNDGEGAQASLRSEFLCSAHVNEIGLAFAVDHTVLWLEIPVDDVHSVQILNGQHQCAEVVPGDGLVEHWHLPYHVKHLSPLDVLQQEIDVVFIVECLDKPDNVREEGSLEDFLLLHDAGLHAFLLDGGFGEALERVQVVAEVGVAD